MNHSLIWHDTRTFLPFYLKRCLKLDSRRFLFLFRTAVVIASFYAGFIVITLRPQEITSYAPYSLADNLLLPKSPYLVSPSSCLLDKKHTPKMVLFVSSRPSDFNMRTAIRETWGFTAYSCGVKVIFGFGAHNNTALQRSIRMESKLHGDVLQARVQDGYRTQTQLVLSFFEWSAQNCNAPLTAKGDDDTWLNIPRLMGFIDEISVPNYVGRILFGPGGTVIRDPNNNQHVNKLDHDSDFYPSYCSGIFYVFRSNLTRIMLNIAGKMQVHGVDDAFITGDVIEVINYLTLKRNGEILRVARIPIDLSAPYPDFTQEDGCGSANYTFMHKIGPTEKRVLYNLPCLDSLKTCSAPKCLPNRPVCGPNYWTYPFGRSGTSDISTKSLSPSPGLA